MGWDAVHVSEVDPRMKDSEILDWATREKRVCATRDSDFHAILAARQATKPSVIRIRIEEITAQTTVDILIQVWSRFEGLLDSGAVVTVTPARIRARSLPLPG